MIRWVYDPVFEWWHLEPMNKPRNLGKSCDLNKMKRELNAANERIKRLIEAGDAMVLYATTPTKTAWKQAKEDKP